MNTSIAAVLQEIQTKTGWSGPRIAAQLGVSQPTVSRILNGQPDCKGSTYDAICRLARVIEDRAVPISDLPPSHEVA